MNASSFSDHDGHSLTVATDALPVAAGSDAVLAGLDQARQRYLEAREVFEQQRAELRQTRTDLEQSEEGRRQAEEEMNNACERVEKARRQAERHRERAERLAASLKTIHKAIQSGNVFELILKACLQITGATRGVYVISAGENRIRVRAAVDVDHYPAAPPSDFLRALCRKALDDGHTVVVNHPSDLKKLPKPTDGETFRNLMAAPVVLMKDLSGVVVVCDKLGGDFSDEDAEVVLSVGDQSAVAVENQRLQHDLIGAYFAIVAVLADAVEVKDSYTHGHCDLVARLARRTADRLGLPELECSIACYGGLLHDIGKIGISDGILNKPGRLTPEEWELMRSHVRMGRDLLSRVPLLQRVADVVLHHHERYDGKGYPDGLKGEQIPLPARIVGTVDAYCAMIAKRSYKESISAAEARAELERCKGEHFDPQVVEALLAVLDTNEEEEIARDLWEPLGMHHPADFRHLIQTFREAPPR